MPFKKCQLILLGAGGNGDFFGVTILVCLFFIFLVLVHWGSISRSLGFTVYVGYRQPNCCAVLWLVLVQDILYCTGW